MSGNSGVMPDDSRGSQYSTAEAVAVRTLVSRARAGPAQIRKNDMPGAAGSESMLSHSHRGLRYPVRM